jgi:hypothetical protein
MEQQDLAQMMHRLLAKMDDYQAKMDETQAKMDENQAKADVNQARLDANHEKRMAMIKAWRRTDTKDNEEEAMACEEKTEVRLEEEEEPTSVEMKLEVADEREVPVQDAAKMPVGEPGKKRRDRRRLAAQCRQKKEEELTEMIGKTHREREDSTSADVKERQETTVCHEATEADIGEMEPIDRAIAILKQTIATTDLNGNTEEMECEEPASVEMRPEVAHQEVPREDAAVMLVIRLRKQRTGRKQDAGRREEPEKLNRGICGSREKLAAACRKVSRRATVAWRRRNVLRQIPTHGSCGLRK